MYRNYFKIAWRNLWKNKTLSVITIGGLAIGMAVCLFISFYVKDELSYDRYHEKADRIYRLTTKLKIQGFDMSFARAGIDAAPLLQSKFPEIEKAIRLKPVKVAVFKKDNTLFNEKDVFMTDREMFSIFSFQFISGDRSYPLAQPRSMVLTERLAQKYFGKTDPVGKTILFNNKSYTVTAVIANLPSNTDLKFQALISWNVTKEEEADWMDMSYFTYLLFKSKEAALAFKSKLNSFDKEEFTSRGKSLGETDFAITHSLQPLTQLHFESPLSDDTPKRNHSYLYILSAIAISVLLVACINFVNLYVVQTTKRQKEVGVRKVAGASKKQLLQQFLGEALLITIIAVVLALFLVELASPFFNKLTEKTISLDHLDLSFTIKVISVLLVAGLVAGSYPAFYVSSLDPVTILKGRMVLTRKFLLRKSLLVSQFTISVVLIICTITAYLQIRFMKEENPGFKQQQVLAITIPPDSAARSKAALLKNRLLENANVSAVSMAVPPVNLDSKASFMRSTEGRKENLMVSFISVDESFLDVLKIPVIKGRNFSAASALDKTKGVIVNEAMVKWMGWKEPLGQKIYPGEDPTLVHEVIGVVKDFHYTSMHSRIEPLLLYYVPDPAGLLVSVSPRYINQVRTAWMQLFPNLPLEYTFLDEAIKQQYENEEKLMTIFTSFTVLTILIACLGLFGLVSMIITQRTKEIGIRKVLGASVQSLAGLLSKDFLQLVCIACIIAFPVAGWTMHKWLQNYAYRIEISWWIFLIAGMVAIFIALFTVSFQAIKAAIANPVKSLRTE